MSTACTFPRGGRRLKDAGRRGVLRLLRRAADRLNFDLVWRDYYSPIPQPTHLTEAIFAARSSLVGVEWREDAQRRFFEEITPEVERFIRCYPDLATSRNGSYEGLDAQVLYAVIRRCRPQRVLEIGSGYSTRVTAAAVRDLRAEGASVEFVAVEPYPSSVLEPLPEGLDRLRTEDVRTLPIAEFERLQANDVLFIDTTHTVKVGSEVNHLLLEVVPRLRPGVVVHIHDIFLPWEYPREWVVDNAFFWSEQYLVYALLLHNSRLEVLLSNHWLQREGGAQLPLHRGGEPPRASGLWVRVTGDDLSRQPD